MSGAPDATVVVPTRDRPHLLPRALRSLAAQTHESLEIVVVDDGSAAATREAVRAFESPRLRYVRHASPRGAAAARNTGVRLARGAFVGFLDDDDEWLPEKLARQIEALRNAPKHVAAVYCGHEKLAPSGAVFSTWLPRDEPLTQRDFLRTTSFETSVPLLRRACVLAVGIFDETLSGGQDRDLWIRLAERYRFHPISGVLVRHYIHGEQITSDLAAKVASKTRLLEKHRSLYRAHPEILAGELERLALLHSAGGDPEGARSLLRETLALSPSAASPRDHLERSVRDPEAHRRHVLARCLPSVEGIPLYY